MRRFGFVGFLKSMFILVFSPFLVNSHCRIKTELDHEIATLSSLSEMTKSELESCQSKHSIILYSMHISQKYGFYIYVLSFIFAESKIYWLDWTLVYKRYSTF